MRAPRGQSSPASEFGAHLRKIARPSIRAGFTVPSGGRDAGALRLPEDNGTRRETKGRV